MLDDLSEKDMDKLLVVWQAAITMANGQVADFREGYIENRHKMSTDEIADFISSRILSYFYVGTEDLKNILLTYIEAHQKQYNTRIKELH